MTTSSKVTFIAMSGVRIYDPELRELGMTLPGFIERGNVIASLPSLGVLTLAGLTPPDWEIGYLEIDDPTQAPIQELLDQPPHLVAISSLTARIKEAYALAAQLKAAGHTVVLGGLHASVMPQEAAEHVDCLVIGEGEPVWQQLLTDFQNGKLQPNYTAPRERSFTPWAVPRYDLLDPNKYNRITLQSTRGCPLDCSFCGASRMISHYKRKEPNRLRAELDAIHAIWPRPFLELADDNTFIHKEWSKEVVEIIGEYGAKWFTETDISLADDDKLLQSLARSGCVQVLIGLETIDADALGETDSKGWKSKRMSEYAQSIAKIQDHGISVNGCFIFGFDNHSPQVFESTWEFIQTSGLAEVQLTILTPFPGTRLYENLKAQGRLLEQNFWEKCTLFDVTFQPAKMSPEQLREGFRELVREVYNDENTAHRKAILRHCMRRSALLR